MKELCEEQLTKGSGPMDYNHQAPLSMGFSRQEYWSGLPFSSLTDLPHPGIERGSSTFQADCFPTEPPGTPIGSEPQWVHLSIENLFAHQPWSHQESSVVPIWATKMLTYNK